MGYPSKNQHSLLKNIGKTNNLNKYQAVIVQQKHLKAHSLDQNENNL